MARFSPLSEHKDVRFGKGRHDVRGWPVRMRADHNHVGEVHDLIVDENGRTRWLDIGLDNGRHVLLPAGDARIDTDNRSVEMPVANRKSLDALPEYDHRADRITPEYATSLTGAYDSAYSDDYFHERSDYSAAWAGGSGETSTRRGKIEQVDQLDDIEVASGQADPRGWDVVGSDGHTIGEVSHLIGDTAAMKVRYLTVKLDKKIASDRHEVLVPVGHVDLDTRGERVLAGSLDSTLVRDFPRYEGGSVNRDYEQDLMRHYSDRYSGERHFEHPRYRADALDTEVARVQRSEEDLRVGKREAVAGQVDVHKRVETEHVREPVKVRREEVTVERHAAKGRSGEADIRDEDIRIPIHEEEVVVEKRPRVKEEIVVKKRDTEDTKIVEEDVRKERVDVDRTGERKRDKRR